MLYKNLTRSSGRLGPCLYQYFVCVLILLSLFTGIRNDAHGQQPPVDSLKVDSLRIRSGKAPMSPVNLRLQYDIGDLFQDIFHPRSKQDSLSKRSGITVIPNIAANPTIGFQIGIKAVAGLKLGSDPRTLMSVAATSASITTKGILYFYITHNVFTNANKWNLQGTLVAAKSVTPDFGLGIGHGAGTHRCRPGTYQSRSQRTCTSFSVLYFP